LALHELKLPLGFAYRKATACFDIGTVGYEIAGVYLLCFLLLPFFFFQNEFLSKKVEILEKLY